MQEPITRQTTAEGSNRAFDAISKAIDFSMNAEKVRLYISTGEDEISMDEIEIINNYIQGKLGNNVHIISEFKDDLNQTDKMDLKIICFEKAE